MLLIATHRTDELESTDPLRLLLPEWSRGEAAPARRGETVPLRPDRPAIDAIVAGAAALPGAYSMVGIEPFGGAIGRVAPDATAFCHRSAKFNLGVWAGWEEASEDTATIAWAHGLHATLAGHDAGGAYVNYLDRDESDDGGRDYAANAGRLAEVKRVWDPDTCSAPTSRYRGGLEQAEEMLAEAVAAHQAQGLQEWTRSSSTTRC